MRSLLATLAALVLVGLAWLWWSPRSAPMAAGPIPTASDEPGQEPRSPDALVAVPERAIAPGDEAAREAVVTEGPALVARPDGFGELRVRVLAGGGPVAGAVVEISEGVDAVLNGEADEQGRGVADERGEVVFFVRPTRTVVLKALDEATARSLEGTYTTPFGGRARTVELELGEDKEAGALSVLVVSEINGAPVPDVRVEIVGDGTESSVEAIGGSDGVVLVPYDSAAEYRFSAPGFVQEDLTYMELEGDVEFQVTLRPYARIFGQVKAEGLGDAPLSREEVEERMRRNRSLPRRASIEIHPEASGGATSWVISGTSARTQTFGGLTRCSPDEEGRWSAQVAIPREVSLWSRVRVRLRLPDGQSRLMAVIPYLRPGDEVAVEDPWLNAPRCTVEVRTPSGEPFGGGRRFLLSATSMAEALQDPAAVTELDREARAELTSLPVGVWSYVIQVPGAPPSWSPSGTFQHDGDGEPVTLIHGGASLTVKVAASEDRRRRYFQLGIAEAGQAPLSITRISEGGSVSFPAVPRHGSWQVVLAEMTARGLSSAGRAEPPELEEVLRVFIEADDELIELHPRGQ